MKYTLAQDMPDMTPILNAGVSCLEFMAIYTRFMMHQRPADMTCVEYVRHRLGRSQDLIFMGSVRYSNWEVSLEDSRYWLVVSRRGIDIEVPLDCTVEQASKIVKHATNLLWRTT